MKLESLRSAVLVLAVLVGAPACRHASDVPGSLQLQLTWTPTDDTREVPSSVLTALMKQTLQVMPFTDQRSNQAQVGSNLEERNARPVTTGDNVGLYVSARVSDIFRDVGGRVVPSGATRVLKGDITQYFVTEDHIYKARVALHLTLQDGAGAPLWEGMTSGVANRWGSSFSERNYDEALSNALIAAVHEVLGRSDFQVAFAGQPPAAPTPVSTN